MHITHSSCAKLIARSRQLLSHLMPELPEVESARKFVEQHCDGLEIVEATVADDDSMRPPPPPPQNLVPSLRSILLLQACWVYSCGHAAEVIQDIQPRDLEAALKGRKLVKAQRKVRCELPDTA